jgi:hypothetical protein
MRKYKAIFFLSTFFLFGCYKVDKLTDSDKIDIISQIIKDEGIKILYDEFLKIDPNDSTLYYISYFPNDVQKYNHSSSIIAFDRLFNKKDFCKFKKQINSFDSTLRLSKFIRNRSARIYPNSDTSFKPGLAYHLSYPLLNRTKNAIIVFLEYGGGMMMGGEYVFIYAKRGGKWVRLSKIMIMMI